MLSVPIMAKINARKLPLFGRLWVKPPTPYPPAILVLSNFAPTKQGLIPDSLSIIQKSNLTDQFYNLLHNWLLSTQTILGKQPCMQNIGDQMACCVFDQISHVLYPLKNAISLVGNFIVRSAFDMQISIHCIENKKPLIIKQA